ncbi:hypothetical protein ABIC56_002923 [Acinetobacter bereziniae]|nr:hypothetical protein [Acinetobacter bereziniae]
MSNNLKFVVSTIFSGVAINNLSTDFGCIVQT